MSLTLRSVHRTYDDFLLDTDFRVNEGEMVSLLGPSGCGKTTTLRIIAGLESPDRGEIIIGGRNVTRLPAHKRGCGVVFQDYALFPQMTVRENAAYGLKITGIARSVRNRRADELLDLVGLSGWGGNKPGTLSGGEKQRVALARALAIRPNILLLDEPLSALDAKLRIRLRREIREIQQRLKITAVYVTHDQEEAMSLSDRIILMDRGRISQIGTPRELYETPETTFCAGFFGRSNLIPGTFTDRGFRLNTGDLFWDEKAERRSGDGHLMFRPEAPEIAANPGANTLDAKVLGTEYLGSERLCEMDAAGERILYSVKTGEDPRPGQKLRIRIPEEKLILLGK